MGGWVDVHVPTYGVYQVNEVVDPTGQPWIKCLLQLQLQLQHTSA